MSNASKIHLRSTRRSLLVLLAMSLLTAWGWHRSTHKTRRRQILIRNVQSL